MGEISQNIQEKLVIVRGGGDLATDRKSVV